MKKIVSTALLGGAIVASLLGAGSAHAGPDEYVGVDPHKLIQISVERHLQLPVGAALALQEAGKQYQAGNYKAASAIVGQVVDGPQWAADPAIEALAQKLPKPVGGTNGDAYTSEKGGTHGKDDDGVVMQFRNEHLLKARDRAREHAQDHVEKAGEAREAIKSALTPKKKAAEKPSESTPEK